MKLQVIFLLATAAISSGSVITPNNTTLDLDAISRQQWVQDFGVRGCNYANQVRAQHGRSLLYYSASLTGIGSRHSVWMAFYNNFQHQNLNGVGAWIGRNWLPVTAENIAMSVPRTNDASWDAHQQWYHSRGHFLNMISPRHTHCGVGIAYDRYGRWWGTQLFGQNRNIENEYGAGSDQPARRPVPAPAPASAAPAPVPATASTPRPRPSPSGNRPSGNGGKPAEEFNTSLLGEPLSIADISEPPTLIPKLNNGK